LCDFLSGFIFCVAKSKQRLHNIFITSLPKVTKNKKRNLG
jgi:hypothetical protein